MTTPPSDTVLPAVAVIPDLADDVAHTHTALASRDPGAGRITLHPAPGTPNGTAWRTASSPPWADRRCSPAVVPPRTSRPGRRPPPGPRRCRSPARVSCALTG